MGASTEGYTFHLFNSLIDWQSSKQRTVVRSTTEAELLALSRATTQLYWWLRVFDQIGLKTYEHPSIECDNAQTVRLMVTDAPKLMTKLRHIDIQFLQGRCLQMALLKPYHAKSTKSS
jgi:hypothetical protein